MRDLIPEGARFCTAFEPLVPDQAAASLDQLARLHANSAMLARTPWLRRRVDDFAKADIVGRDTLQELLNGPRSAFIDPKVRDADLLIAALKALADIDATHAQTLVHGDCHAGNLDLDRRWSRIDRLAAAPTR